MATINASVSNFMALSDLTAKGIGTGQTISRPTVPAFLSNSMKRTGVNYASAFYGSMLNTNTLGGAISQYNSEKSSFQSEFRQAMGDARKTGEALKNVDYGGKEAATGAQSKNAKDSIGGLLSNLNSLRDRKNPLEARENGVKDFIEVDTEDNTEELAEKNDELARDPATAALAHDSTKMPPKPDATDTAQELTGLIDQYNDTVNYLQSKVGMSSQFDFFAASFQDTRKFMGTMEDIGINVEPTGTLSVNTQSLTEALQARPDSVEQALGAEGLAGQIDRNTASSDFRAERVFPRIDEALGHPNESTKGMYAPNMQISSTMRGDRGNLMDMYY